MSFVPDREPMLTFGNATGQRGTGDLFGRSGAYLHDPEGWVRSCFAKARAAGFRWLRFHMPNGHDPTQELYRCGVFGDLGAHDAACEETELFAKDGGKVCLYTGRIEPTTGALLMPGCPALGQIEEWARWGLRRVEFDNTGADLTHMAALLKWGAGIGLSVGGEAYPVTAISGGRMVLKSAWIRSCPWVILHGTAKAWDPMGLWGVNPAATELRQMVYAPAFDSPAACVEYVRKVKGLGQIADQLEVEGVDELVTGEILRAAA